VHLVLPVKLFALEEQQLQESEALLVTAHPTVRMQCQILALMAVKEVLLAAVVAVLVAELLPEATVMGLVGVQFEVVAVMDLVVE
jgi:hypothetical protein